MTIRLSIVVREVTAYKMMKTKVITGRSNTRCCTGSDQKNKQVSFRAPSEDSSAQKRNQRVIALLDEAIALADEFTSTSKVTIK